MNETLSTPPSPPETEASPASAIDKPYAQNPIANVMASLSTPTPSSSISPQSNAKTSAVRRNCAPPRNDDGEITCIHPDCLHKTDTFRRPCEWNKHMDRHERPYTCKEASCELIQGFTYSGGLLRHQREVHKMHNTTKQPLFCPFPNCNRSSGTGFTRKENLEEHKRRRHLDELSNESKTPSSLMASSVTPNLPTAVPVHDPLVPSRQRSRKRKRPMTPQPADGDDAGTSDDAEDSPLVKRLRDEIQRMQNENTHLRNMIASWPQQAVYNVNPMMGMQQQQQHQHPQMYHMSTAHLGDPGVAYTYGNGGGHTGGGYGGGGGGDMSNGNGGIS